jgi:mannose-6-phosphate isomerase
LHAYLEGFGIELMANSDNVLRGGLTSKHIDLAELARVLTYRPADPQVRVPLAISAVENFYQTPTEEFALSVLNPAGATTYQAAASRNVEILLVTAGQAEIACSDKMPPLKLRQGDSVLIPAAAPAYRLYGDAQVFKSTVPQG